VEEGPLWRRRLVDPEDRPEWMLIYDSGDSEDGVITAGIEGEIQQWDAGHFVLRGECFDLAWLEGQEAEEAIRDYGW
jgi:hypothetical protein